MRPPSYLIFVLLLILEPSAKPMVATAQSSSREGHNHNLFSVAWNPIRGLTSPMTFTQRLTHSHSASYCKVDWVFDSNIKTI